jgi:hypothetical protein
MRSKAAVTNSESPLTFLPRLLLRSAE